MITVHMFYDSKEAYDESQSNDAIKKYDVLWIPSEDVVAFMLSAWPVAVTVKYGKLHTLSDEGVIDAKTNFEQQLINACEVAQQLGYRLDKRL